MIFLLSIGYEIGGKFNDSLYFNMLHDSREPEGDFFQGTQSRSGLPLYEFTMSLVYGVLNKVFLSQGSGILLGVRYCLWVCLIYKDFLFLSGVVIESVAVLRFRCR